jgi:hypothetical protein
MRNFRLYLWYRQLIATNGASANWEQDHEWVQKDCTESNHPVPGGGHGQGCFCETLWDYSVVEVKIEDGEIAVF